MCNSVRVAVLTVATQWDGSRTVLTLRGDLDLATGPELRRRAEQDLATADCATLTLDLSGLAFVDSSGLGVLVELRNLTRQQGVALELVKVPPGPTRIMEIAGLAVSFGLPVDDGGARA